MGSVAILLSLGDPSGTAESNRDPLIWPRHLQTSNLDSAGPARPSLSQFKRLTSLLSLICNQRKNDSFAHMFHYAPPHLLKSWPKAANFKLSIQSAFLSFRTMGDIQRLYAMWLSLKASAFDSKAICQTFHGCLGKKFLPSLIRCLTALLRKISIWSAANP